jgi:hypothetical protein
MATISKAKRNTKVVLKTPDWSNELAPIAYKKHGLGMDARRLPDEYRVVLPTMPPRGMTINDVLIDQAGVLLTGSEHILDLLSMSTDPLTVEVVGNYQQLVKSYVDLIAKLKGGSLAAGKYGRKIPIEELSSYKVNYANALSMGLTKFKHAFEYIQENGIHDDKGRFQKTMVKGMAGVLAGSRALIEGWAKLEAWQQKKERGVNNGYLEAYSKPKA